MICRDWRDAAPEDVAALYATERKRWLDELAWDPIELLEVIERGRRSGHVAGWIAYDQDEREAGWTFYILHNGLLQIGGLVGERPSVVRRLLDAVLSSPEASVSRGLSCFIYPSTTGTSAALERQRFSLRESLYLTRSLGPPDLADDPAASGMVRPWTTADFAGTVRILAASYAGVPAAECFAPDGTREQWAHYAGQILRTPGCGRFDPALSRIVCAPGASTPAAVALTTWIAPDAVHVAQIAVAPDRRRQGFARVLMQSVLRASAEAGAVRMTLMVDGSNRPAVSLYESLGFAERTRMIFGSRAARTRVAA